jgi:hypothetical protein
METILERFKKKYGYLEKYGMSIDGLYLISESDGATFKEEKEVSNIYELREGENYELTVFRPFVFDNRILPKLFEGVNIKIVEVGARPLEFDVDENENFIPLDVYHSPEKYIKFVDRCFDDIRLQLGNPNMSKEELLDALTFEGSFEKHIKWCKEMRDNVNKSNKH